MRSKFLEAGESKVFSHVGSDALQGSPGHDHADIVDDQALDRALWARSEDHADEAPHRSADPIEVPPGISCGDPRNQRGHVGAVLGIVVVFLVVKPLASAAADDVRAHHAEVGQQRLCERIEIPTAACEAVGADHDGLRVGVSPFQVMHAVKPVLAQAQQISFTHGPPL